MRRRKDTRSASIEPVVLDGLRERYRIAYLSGAVCGALAFIVYVRAIGLLVVVPAALGAGLGAAALFLVDLARTNGGRSVALRSPAGSEVRASRADLVAYLKHKVI